MFIEQVMAAGELAEPVRGLLNKIAIEIINPLVSLAFGVAMLYFLWGVYQFIYDASVEKHKERQMHLIFGVVGLAIMVSVWGILQFLCNNVSCQ